MNRLILSVGMPRAGSGWHYNLVHDLVVAGGGAVSQQVRRRYFLRRILTEVNCNIGHLGAHRLLPVLVPVLLGSTFTVKAHAGPTPLALSLVRRGLVLPTYIYRDPRAALLSAYEYGQRGLAEGRRNPFSGLTTLEQAAEFMQPYVRISEAWLACEQALHVRYESLVDDYESEAGRLARFLSLQDRPEVVRGTIEKYGPERGEARQRGTHFSHGKAERFRAVFTPDQLENFNRMFCPYLERMGYAL
ncbi:MAG TPA: sulfotransferase domain-containing protein [Anaerolineales bacterium]